MRTIVNISLNKDLQKVVEGEVKRGKFSSKSEFFRNLLRLWIEEGRLLEELEESRKELKAGRGKLLRSLKNLR